MPPKTTSRPLAALLAAATLAAPAHADQGLLTFLSPNPHLAIETRIKAIQAPARYTPQDIALLTSYLLTPASCDTLCLSIPRQHVHLMKNEALITLWDLPLPTSDLRRIAQHIYQGEKDPVMRDYALQFATRILYRPNCTGRDASAIIDLLHHGTEEHATSVSGTAILSLRHLLADGYSNVSQDKTTSAAQKILLDPDAHLGSRSAAIACLFELSHTTAHQLAQDLLADANTPPSLRQAATGLLSGDRDLDHIGQTAEDIPIPAPRNQDQP